MAGLSPGPARRISVTAPFPANDAFAGIYRRNASLAGNDTSATHRLCRVAFDDVAERLVDLLEDLGVEPYARGLDVLAHLLRPGRADDRRRHVRVLQHPRDRQLRHRQPDAVG